MKLITNYFKPNPKKIKEKNARKLNKLLYAFAKSEYLTHPVSYEKKFRVHTFWDKMDSIIPDMFEKWSESRGIKIEKLNSTYNLNGFLFKWKKVEYKFSNYGDFYVGYQIVPENNEAYKPYKYLVHSIVIRIENSYPKEVLLFYLDNKKSKYTLLTKYGKDKYLSNFEDETLRSYFLSDLKTKERVDKTLRNVQIGLEQYNEILVTVRSRAERDFRNIAETHLQEMASKGMPLQGIPFKEELDKHAEWLSNNILDDYDLNFWQTNKYQLDRAINTAKNKIINKY